MRFDGKLAVVTGGCRGIGRAIAERLATEGARVVILDIESVAGQAASEALQAKGHDVSFATVDITRTEQVEATVGDTVDRHGPIHVLVNNAALVRSTTIESSDDEAFEAIFSVNVRGTLAVTRAVSRSMIDASIEGSIVNMSSITAAHGAANLVLYSASKGAISAMTRSVAVGLADFGIRVNAVAPGSIGTEAAGVVYRKDPGMLRQVLSRTPLRRMGSSDEIASVAAFLASDDASYITGQVIYPDGGRLALGYTVAVDESQLL